MTNWPGIFKPRKVSCISCHGGWLHRQGPSRPLHRPFNRPRPSDGSDASMAGPHNSLHKALWPYSSTTMNGPRAKQLVHNTVARTQGGHLSTSDSSCQDLAHPLSEEPDCECQPQASGAAQRHTGGGGCQQQAGRVQELIPPVAPYVPHQLSHHGHVHQDGWYWLRDPACQTDLVRGYLAAEKAYCQSVLSEMAALRDEISQHVDKVAWHHAVQLAQGPRLSDLVQAGPAAVDAATARTQSLQLATPASGTVFGSYQYIRARVASAPGQVLEQHLRVTMCNTGITAGSQPAAQVVLDEQYRAAGRPGYRMGMVVPSPAFSHIAFTECEAAPPGRSARHLHYTLHVHCAETGQPVVSPIPGVRGLFAWSPDGGTLFYTSGRCLGSSLFSLPIPSPPKPDPAQEPAQEPAQLSGNSGSGTHVMTDPDGLQFAFRQVKMQSSCTGDPGGSSGMQEDVLLCEAIDSELRAHEVWAWLPPGHPLPVCPPHTTTATRSSLPNATAQPSDTATSMTRDDGHHANQQNPTSSRGHTWRVVVPRTPGSRALLHPLYPHHAGAVICHWDAAHPNGQLWLCDIGCHHSAQSGLTSAAPSATHVAGRFQRLLPDRAHWRILGVQTQSDALLVTLLSVAHEGDTTAAHADSSSSSGSRSTREQQQSAAAAPGQSCSSLLRFEVHAIRSSSTPSATPVAEASPHQALAMNSLQLVAEGWLELPVPCFDMSTPVWCTEAQPASPASTSLTDSELAGAEVTHCIECEVSSTCMPPQRAMLQLSPPAQSDLPDAAGLPDQGAEEVGEEGAICHSVLYAESADSSLVPVTLSYQHNTSAISPRPLALLVYGAYGRDAYLGYESYREVLLSKGWGVAVAHVRGGGGPASVRGVGNPAWHVAGSKQHKSRGLQDLLAAARLLIQHGWGVKGQLSLISSSAGAWLAGAALNSQPHLFATAVLTVPSLDILTTMCDDADSVHELGDVLSEESAYQAMLAWSPVDTLPGPAQLAHILDQQTASQCAHTRPKLFPHVLVRLAVQDTSVQFWESAKYVAKLRHVLRGGGRLGASRRDARQPVVVMQVAEQGGHAVFEDGDGQAQLAAFLMWCADLDVRAAAGGGQPHV